ncbi:nonribosomal peptide synthetase gliP [Aspergillus stella-maris]|uniref:nonribosomal peptide synthetase gliP n=1 Tax=Aspergillus stella-maris TaxID=1810926 RepID=UPI003CCD8ACA
MTRWTYDVCELFARSVRRTPHMLAVDHETASLTYEALDLASSRAAYSLRRKGVQRGDAVLLLTEHGTYNLVALLAILKAGACYVPMDRGTWSPERIQTVVDAVETRFMINTTPAPFESDRHNVIHLPRDLPDLTPLVEDCGGNYDKALDSIQIKPDDVCCLIFTSGSTGKPKGVLIPHRAVASYAQTSPFNMDVQSGDQVLHILSVAFDASTGMLFSILGNSGTVVPATMDNLYEKAQSCTISASTPSILATLPLPSAIPDGYPSIHTVLLGGETPSTSLLAAWLDHGVRILNAYGPTETTCASLMQVVERSQDTGQVNSSIIGISMPKGTVYLLRPDLTPIEQVENSEEGEVVITGIGLANGYYKNPTLTAERFITWRGTRAYRTGDQGRWVRRNDGLLVVEFRGRSDRTVKNRGFLVNLPAEVEEPLRVMGGGYGVTDVYAAMIRSQLVALVTPETADLGGLKSEAQGHLSAFHTPDLMYGVREFPLSANGKIDTKAIEALLQEKQALRAGAGEANALSSTARATNGTQQPSVDQVIAECLYTALGLGVPVSPRDINFFEMGGNSLMALRLTSLCREKGVSLITRDVYIYQTLNGIIEYVCSNPESTSQTSQPEPSGDNQEMDTLSALRTGVAEYLQLDDPLPEHIKFAPLTTVQLELSAPTCINDGANTNQFRLSYPLAEGEKVCQAWQQVSLFEPIFRTEVTLDVGSGVQIAHARPIHAPLEKQYFRRSDYDAAMAAPSDLAVGLGMRLVFHKYTPTSTEAAEQSEVTVEWTVHHSLLDGYSLGFVLAQVQHALIGEPLIARSSFLEGASNLLALQKRRDEEARRFWQTYLAGVGSSARAKETKDVLPPSIDMPYLAREVRFEHAPGIQPLLQLAADCKVTLATVYYTAWAVTLRKFYNAPTVTFGAVFSGREALPEYADAVGPFMSVLPLVRKLDKWTSVEQELQETLQQIANVSAYAWCSPEQIGYRVRSLVATQYDFPVVEEVIAPLRSRFFENTAFPLSLLIDEDARFRLVYNPSSHEVGTAKRLATMFLTTLSALVKPERAVAAGEVESTSSIEPDRAEGQGGSLVSAFHTSVDKYASLTAVEDPDGNHLTYAELDRQSNIVAAHIADTIPNAHVIAIHADGSLNWVVGILGILKSGAAYCPLDPVYPMARKVSVYKRSGATVLLIPNTKSLSSAKLDLPDLTLALVDELVARGAENRQHPPREEPNKDALIVYTSGTTGVPKGVPISHRGLLALQSNPEATMFSQPGKRIAQFMSPAFDYCANEIFSAILHGGTLVLRDPTNPLATLGKVDVATITPSVLSVLDPADYPNLSMVYATGEPVTPGLVDRWACGREFYNAYGPAECSICTSFTKLVPGQMVTIGRAIRTARMYILTPDLTPVTGSEVGEIILAGQQVMRGYLGDEEKTASRVVADPWHPGERMYRTGDYGYWSEEKEIVYIGRIDRQVKVRGYRVELGAVEQRMQMEEPMLTQAAVLVVNETLVAFVMPRTINVTRLQHRLREALQPSWVPQVITPLESFPWTANRKVDYQKLEEMTTLAPREKNGASDVSDSDCIADQVGRIWKEILRLDKCTTLAEDADFLTLGGHSILQIMLASRLGKHFGLPISISDIIQNPTLDSQMELIRCRKKEEPLASTPAVAAVNLEIMSENLLSPLERQTWFQYHVASDVRAFNIPVLLHLDGHFDRSLLVRSIDTALAHRKAFRTNFIETCDGPYRIFRKSPPQVQQCDDLDTEEEIDSGFDLARDELIRVFLHRNTLLIVTSHAVADLNSVQNLLRDISAVYSGSTLLKGERWAYTQSPAWSHKISPEDQKFWTHYLSGAPKQLYIPRQPGKRLTFEGRSRLSHFHGPNVTRLLALGKQHGMTQHQLVVTAVAQILQWLAGTNDLVLGSPWANRSHDLEQSSVGLFLDRLPLRITTPADADISTLLSSTRQSCQTALCHAAPFEQILHALRLPRTIEQHPIFETMVTFHLKGAVEDCLNIEGATTRREMAYSSGAKFLLMFEWTELESGDWILRIEYDHTQIEDSTIQVIEEGLYTIHARLGRRNTSLSGEGAMTLTQGAREEFCNRLVSILAREMASCLDVPVAGFPSATSFFDNGGNSLAVWRLQRQLKRVGLEVDICSFFQYPSAQGLAEFLCARLT